MKKAFIIGITLATSFLTGNAAQSNYYEKQIFTEACTSGLEGIYPYRTSQKICSCAYRKVVAGVDPYSAGQQCAIQHGGF
tara:strand:- start:95 stop:334 length:240 start_codon:yes stop_codon:yes gene_type:complete